MSFARSYFPPKYEDIQAKRETQETPESHLLLVEIPDGFTREQIGAKVEYDFGRVRVFGERPLGNNTSSRFNEIYQVPSYCDINRIKGKFDGRIITITMPKIPGAQVPKQEPQSTQQEQEAPKTQPQQGSDHKEGLPPQPATRDDKEKTTASEVKDQKGQQGPSDHDPKSKVEAKEEAGHETSNSTPQEETTKEPLPQKGKEEIPQKDEVTKNESKGESMPQKGEESIPQKATVTTTTDAKLQTEEKSADENKEKQRIGEEENKDNTNKTVESGNPPEEKAKVEDSSSPEKEIKEESKESAKVENFSPEKEKGKEINGEFGDDGEKKSETKAMIESTRTGIKEMAASTSQAVTNLAKRFSEEDKQKMIYMGAAVFAVALGVYASYKFRSSRRP